MEDVLIVGAGPAGTGVLSALFRLQKRALKIRVIDASPVEVQGTIGRYDIPSDTRAEKFLTCLDGLPPFIVNSHRVFELSEKLREHGASAAPLKQVGDFYRALGAVLRQEMMKQDRLNFSNETRLNRANWTGDHWSAEIERNGKHETIKTRQLVLACGATEAMERPHDLLHQLGLSPDKLKQFALSSDVLMSQSNAAIFKYLASLDAPKVAIIGGSHSAISAANKLLSEPASIDFKSGAISIYHRSPLRVTFESAEAARKYGFTDFGPDDICPATKRVFALKGFRLDAAKLLMAIERYVEPYENRICLVDLNGLSKDVFAEALSKADLVVSALGYEPDYPPLYDETRGTIYALNSPNYVDAHSQLKTMDGRRVPNAYGLGLAANYNLAGRFGEPSFTGQANGLVLWHKTIGEELASRLLEGTG